MSREDGKEIVLVLRNTLIQRLGKDRYELWFGDRVKFALEAGALVVSTAEGFHLERIKSSFRRELTESAGQLLGEGAPLEFRLDTATAGSRPRVEDASSAPGDENDSEPSPRRLPAGRRRCILPT